MGTRLGILTLLILAFFNLDNTAFAQFSQFSGTQVVALTAVGHSVDSADQAEWRALEKIEAELHALLMAIPADVEYDYTVEVVIDKGKYFPDAPNKYLHLIQWKVTFFFDPPEVDPVPIGF